MFVLVSSLCVHPLKLVAPHSALYLWKKKKELSFHHCLSPNTAASKRSPIFSQNEILPRRSVFEGESCAPTLYLFGLDSSSPSLRSLGNCGHLFSITAAQRGMCTVPHRGHPPPPLAPPHSTKSPPRLIVDHKLRASWLLWHSQHSIWNPLDFLVEQKLMHPQEGSGFICVLGAVFIGV